MNTSRCDHCDTPLPAQSRADARYCSGAHRVAALRARRESPPTPGSRTPAPFPAALTDRARWVRRSEAKVPLTVTGAVASSTDPATWSAYNEAADSKAGAGLGFVCIGDGIGCIDLDHCVSEDGTLSADAARVLAECSGTYIEVSASGDGLHVWGKGIHVSSRKLRGSLAGEVIGSRKYVAMGTRYNDAPLTLKNIGHTAGRLMNER